MTKMNLTIEMNDPRKMLPPLNTPILAVVESSVDRGRGFKREYDFRVLRITCQDVDWDEDEGAAIWGELERDELKWDDAQLRLESGVVEIDDFYSDSIVWWAPVPKVNAP